MTPQALRLGIIQLAIEGKLLKENPDGEQATDLLRSLPQNKKKTYAPIADGDIPFEIPSNWKWVRMGQLIDLIGGVSYDKRDVTTSGIRILRGGNISSNHIYYFDEDVFLPESYFDDQKVVRKGDTIIVASTGSKTVIGKPGYVLDNSSSAMIGAFLRICRPKINGLSQFVNLLFQSDLYRKRIRDLSQGTNINNVKESYITEMIVPLPPLTEQKLIVERVEELLRLVEQYETVYNRLQELNASFPGELRFSVLQQAIEGRLVEQQSAEGTGRDVLELIKRIIGGLPSSKKLVKDDIETTNMPFEIPESWAWARLSDLCVDVKYGTSKKSSKKGAVPVLRMGNILPTGELDYDNLVYTDDQEDIEAYELKPGDLLFNRTNSREWVGKTALYKGEMKAIYAGYIIRMRPVLMVPEFLLAVMLSPYQRRFCWDVKSDAIGQSNINAKKIGQLLVPIPPLEEQKRIVKKLEEILPICKMLMKDK